jgi:quercetin dioxygenase-like cupin family protein
METAMHSDHKTRWVPSVLALAFLATATPTITYAADVPDALAAGWKGEKLCENLHEDEQIRVLRCIFPPNVGHEPHSHPASFLYVLTGGHGTVTDSNGMREFDVKTDESRPAKPVVWHEMLNTGDSTLRYLIVEKKYQVEK